MESLTIAKDGKVVYTRAIGYAQIDGTTKKPLTATSRFKIASIGKLYTAAIIMQLVEERKLKLTDTLDKFFPQIPNASKIAIVQKSARRFETFSYSWANARRAFALFALPFWLRDSRREARLILRSAFLKNRGFSITASLRQNGVGPEKTVPTPFCRRDTDIDCDSQGVLS